MNFRRALAGIFLLQSACAVPLPSQPAVSLSLAGPPVAAEETGQGFLYRVPSDAVSGGWQVQQWAMLGREDLGAATGDAEYHSRPCEPVSGSAAGIGAVIDVIRTQAANRRVVIVNESHAVTRHRDTIRLLLEALRPLGFSVYAAETFSNSEDTPDPVNIHPERPWVHVMEGYYTSEPVFGNLLRQVKMDGYRLVAYEETPAQAAPDSADRATRIATRESAQAENIAAILATMDADERLIVHVGYTHVSEVETGGHLWMAARLKAMTGIDPLTISQTLCSTDEREPFLARLPEGEPAGLVDLVLSQPVARFDRSRPQWRRDAGYLDVPIPQELRDINTPLIVEAFRFGDPFEAVAIDRIYIEPNEDIPLLLPPGAYTVRGILPPAEIE